MADTLIAGLSAAQAEAIQAAYLLMLADRNWLGGLPTLHYAGRVNDMLSNVLTVVHYGLMGYDSAAQTAEGASPAATELSDGKTQITVNKHTHIISPSDMAKMILGASKVLDPGTLALNAAAIGAAKLSDLICDVIDGFTATAGPGTGNNATLGDLLAAIGMMGTLNVDKSRGFTGVLHGQQWSDILVDAEATAGAIAFTLGQGESAPLLQLSPGAKGKWGGIDWIDSNRVVTANAGADRAGGIWGYGGVVWGDGLAPVEDPGQQVAVGQNVLFERDRNAPAGMTSYVTHTYLGVSKALECGVTFISDA